MSLSMRVNLLIWCECGHGFVVDNQTPLIHFAQKVTSCGRAEIENVKKLLVHILKETFFIKIRFRGI